MDEGGGIPRRDPGTCTSCFYGSASWAEQAPLISGPGYCWQRVHAGWAASPIPTHADRACGFHRPRSPVVRTD